MTTNVALYAALKTFYSQDDDSLAAISIFVLLKIFGYDSLETIKLRLKGESGLDIPYEVLKTILARLKKRGYIAYASYDAINLLDSGREKQASFQGTLNQVEKDYKVLITDLRSFLFARQIKVSLKELPAALLNFIDNNIDATSEVILKGVIPGSRKKLDAGIAQYMLESEHTRPELFKVLQEIFFGRLYILLVKTRSEVDKKAVFHDLAIFLDTNVLLCLLDLDSETLCRPIQELVELVQKLPRVKVAVLRETIDEAKAKLQSYKKHAGNISSHMPLDSIYYRLKLLGYDEYKINLLTESLMEKVEDLGIEVVTLENVDEKDAGYFSQRISSVATAKEGKVKNEFSLKHDASMLGHIKMLRKGTPSTKLLEKSKAVVLSADGVINVLTREMAGETNDFPYSLRPIELASLVWLKNLDLDGAGATVLKHSLMAYAKERLISEGVWVKFVNRLNEAARQGNMSDQDIALIIASEETRVILAENPEDASDLIINDEYVGRLRQEREDLQMKAIESTAQLDTIDQKLLKISVGVAILVSVVIWALVLFVLVVLLARLAAFIGWGTIANLFQIITLPALLILALLFGDKFRLTIFVVSARDLLYATVKRVVYDKLRSYLRTSGATKAGEFLE